MNNSELIEKLRRDVETNLKQYLENRSEISLGWFKGSLSMLNAVEIYTQSETITDYDLLEGKLVYGSNSLIKF